MSFGPQTRAHWRVVSALALAVLVAASSVALALPLKRSLLVTRASTTSTFASKPAAELPGAVEPAVLPDPLAANGFSSPSCTTASLFSEISATARTDCDVSGVAVASVPLSNYAIDSNIDSGLGASFTDDVDSIIEDLVVTPVWTALVWLIHVAVVALEWCYSIDLLAPNMLGNVSNALGGAERILTAPWLGLALAIAAIGFVWHGMVRRRVVETLGQAGVMLVMMSVGLWIIADPAGTIGAVAHFADDAAISTVAATATGSSGDPVGSLDGALGEVFDSAITGPWCYLEFGDVDWCREPSRLDPRLEATGRQLERLYAAGATCRGSAPGLVQCAPGGSAEQREFAGTALALSAARTNGALFLALPANGLARNALSSETPLPTVYGTLCGGTNATSCTASTAPQAEFRTEQGTWPRVGGLILIAIGVAGMLATLGFIALRLLGAAMALLMYLLLAPVAVLAPAFGDAGRDTFRHWLVRLAGASLAKLVYSVTLGISLLVIRLLTSLTTLGWWTQWLLISVFWWLAFEHRHRLLGYVIHERGESGSHMPISSRVRHGTRALAATVDTGRAVARTAGTGVATAHEAWHRALGGSSGARPDSLAGRKSIGTREAHAALVTQVERALASDGVADEARVPVLGEEVATLRARRDRLSSEEIAARGAGARRRAASLALRADNVNAEIAARTRDLAVLRDRVSTAGGRSGWEQSRRADHERSLRAQLLDREALAPDAKGARPVRDYGALASLAGLTAAEYERQPESDRRRTRLTIERELTQRRVWLYETEGEPRMGSPRMPTGVGDLRRASARPALIGRRARQFLSRER
ncbi:MAG: hypothetical protein ABSG64_12560 [Solirubrobacteraceae bacterium]